MKVSHLRPAFLRISRVAYQWGARVAHSIPFFHRIPARLRKKLVRNIFGRLANLYVSSSAQNEVKIALGSHTLYVPRSLFTTYALRSYEPDTEQLFKEIVQDGMHVIDCGANIGYFTILASNLVGSHGRVYAVEPGPDNLYFLQKNIKTNSADNVILLPYAAGGQIRARQFFIRKTGSTNSFYASTGESPVDSVEVREIPLDSIITERIDFIKLDVEGEEIEALKGMSNIIQRSPNIRLLVEWAPKRLKDIGYDPLVLPQMLLDLGFMIKVLSLSDHVGMPQEPAEILAYLDSKKFGSAVNLYARRSIN